MPLTQIDTALNGTFATQNTLAILGHGRLRQVSVIITSVNSLSPIAFAQVGLGQSSGPQNQISCLLTSGYLSSTNGIEWSGNLELEQEMFILMQIQSDTTATARLTWIVEV